MSFLGNIKANNVGGNFGSAFMSSVSADSPFGAVPAKTATPAKPITPSAPVGSPIGVPVGVPVGAPAMPKAPMMGVPTMPVGAGAKPVTPAVSTSTTQPTSVDQTAPIEEETKVEEKPSVKEAKTEPEKAEEKPAVKEAKAEPEKVEEKPKTRRRRSTNKDEVKVAVTEESAAVAETVETLFKMPSTNMKYADAVKAVRTFFVDENWEAYRKELIAECDSIVIESDMQETAIKKTIAQLNNLRDKIWVEYNDTQVLLENLSNKETEGLIERIKLGSLEGSNETSRKKAAVMAVMNYKTPEGKNINLYEVYDETKARFSFLKSLMNHIQFKSNILITTMSAVKSQRNSY